MGQHPSHDHDHDHDHHEHEPAAPAGAAHAGHSHHGHSHGPGGHAHGASDQTRVLIAACLTGGFMVAEAVGGFVTGSLALLADAGHMMADSIALFLAWYAFRLSARQATARMTYGFGRVKTLVAYTNGVTIFAIAVWIVVEAVQRFLDPPPILGGPMLIIAGLGLLVNIVGFFVLHGGDRTSLNMRGAILHVLGDMLGSAAAIAAAIVILLTGWTPIDPILSVLVALLILSTAWSLMREAAHVLLEGMPAQVDSDVIRKDIETSVQGVRNVHHIHVWSMDGAKAMATLHACLADGTDAQRAVRDIKLRLSRKHGIGHVTVEPEYAECADARPAHLH